MPSAPMPVPSMSVSSGAPLSESARLISRSSLTTPSTAFALVLFIQRSNVARSCGAISSYQPPRYAATTSASLSMVLYSLCCGPCTSAFSFGV